MMVSWWCDAKSIKLVAEKIRMTAIRNGNGGDG
jgi:hypothetical protein